MKRVTKVPSHQNNAMFTIYILLVSSIGDIIAANVFPSLHSAT